MPRFFVTADQIENGIVTIVGDDAHHLSRSCAQQWEILSLFAIWRNVNTNVN